MITGDDPFTACAVAAQCRMINLNKSLILNSKPKYLCRL